MDVICHGSHCMLCCVHVIRLQTYSLRDLLSTAVEHIALQVARAVSTHCSSRQDGVDSKPLRLLVTGGGFYNSFLLGRIGEALDEAVPRGVVVERRCDADTVDFKEALVFAFLGLRCLLGLVNVDSAVTGAALDTVSGAVHLGVDRAGRCAAFHDDMRANLRKSSNAVPQRDSSALLPQHCQLRRTKSAVVMRESYSQAQYSGADVEQDT